MTLKEKLHRGILRCPCSRKAIKVAAGSGVCARCLRLETISLTRTRVNSPTAKYADTFFAPDYGRKTGLPDQ